MKKFGIGKKDKGEEAEDSKRSQLFGKSSKSKSSAPPANPYAAPQNGFGQDPYAKSSPYPPSDPSRSSVASQPPPYPGGGGYGGVVDSRARQDKSPVPPGGYGGAPRFNNSGYGNQGGYGSDKFGGPGGGANPPARSGGGYGGLGQPQDRDDNRDALFGGAKQRVDERQNQGLPPDDGQPGGGYGMDPGYDEQSYKKYEDRQLTAEEEEEEDVQDTKQKIRQMKQEDVSSTRNALRIAAQAEESGRGTLERLGAQGEKIHNTEKNLDLAASGNREAEEKAREIKHLNRSMWAMQVNNPFTKTRRKAERDERIIDTHRNERADRDATRAAAWSSANRQAETDRKLRDPMNPATKKSNLAERSKYQFEADSEDEAMEDEIDTNIDALGGAANRLNRLGKAMNSELEVQNKHIDRIGEKADNVDDSIVMNRARLDRIH